MCVVHVFSLMVIENILRSFELLLGLRVNFQKSKIGGMGIEDDVLEKLIQNIKLWLYENLIQVPKNAYRGEPKKPKL